MQTISIPCRHCELVIFFNGKKNAHFLSIIFRFLETWWIYFVKFRTFQCAQLLHELYLSDFYNFCADGKLSSQAFDRHKNCRILIIIDSIQGAVKIPKIEIWWIWNFWKMCENWPSEKINIKKNINSISLCLEFFFNLMYLTCLMNKNWSYSVSMDCLS